MKRVCFITVILMLLFVWMFFSPIVVDLSSGEVGLERTPVYVNGQNSYSFPSIYTNRREISWRMMNGNFSYPTYMVGGKKGEGKKALYSGIHAITLRRSFNGRGYIGRYYQPEKKY